MKKGTKAALAFLAVCAMGLFVAAAGGVEWGTTEAGFVAFMIFIIGGAAALPATA